MPPGDANEKPSAPRLELLEHHYGSEVGCDVVFLVGPSQDCLRIPAHSHILKDATPVFTAMFSSNFFTQQKNKKQQKPRTDTSDESSTPEDDLTLYQIPVPDLDGKAFDNLMKHIYDVQLILQSAETTVETLKAAHKYQCVGLVRKCVTHLTTLITVNSVLLITANVYVLCGDFQNLENLHRECREKPDSVTFPQTLERQLCDENSELNIELDCAWLVSNCLNFIDGNAMTVLQSDEIEDLDISCIQHILSRDTLDVGENVVFTALIRWADKECKRRHLPLKQESKRAVLQDLLYLPRYLRMSSSDFLSGPGNSGLLTPEEVETITHLLQIGPDAFAPTPESSPYKRVQSLGIPASKSLRIHLGYLLRPRRSPNEKKDYQGSGGQSSGNQERNWVQRLKRMRCCLLCCERSNKGRSASPVSVSSDDDCEISVNTLRRQNPKVGFVERAVVIFACLFD